MQSRLLADVTLQIALSRCVLQRDRGIKGILVFPPQLGSPKYIRVPFSLKKLWARNKLFLI